MQCFSNIIVSYLRTALFSPPSINSIFITYSKVGRYNMQYQEENYESLDKLEASLTKTKLKWKISGSDKRLN
jgi:hypothetical protein